MTPDEVAGSGRDLRRRGHRPRLPGYERLLRRRTRSTSTTCSLCRSASSMPRRSAGALSGALPHIMVDEYQDTNRVQYVLVSALAERTATSSSSAIPTSRSTAGARPTSATSSTSSRTTPTLARSTSSSTTARPPHRRRRRPRHPREHARIDRRLRTENDDGEQIVLRELTDQEHEAQFIVDEIRRMAEIDGVADDDVAVMYRTTAQSRAIEEAFRSAASPTGSSAACASTSAKRSRTPGRPSASSTTRPTPSASSGSSATFPSVAVSVRGARGDPHLGRTRARTMLEGFLASPDPQRRGSPADRNRATAARVGAVFAPLREMPTDIPSELFDAVVEQTGFGGPSTRRGRRDGALGQRSRAALRPRSRRPPARDAPHLPRTGRPGRRRRFWTTRSAAA